VLKLMAKVIYRLWKDDNKDLMILPGSLPLHDGSSRNELTYYLPAGWDAVIERDIDGDRAETTELENKEPRFGQVGAARRVARTIFLGSAPSSVATKVKTRGIDRAHIVLGCLQPGQASSVYADATRSRTRPDSGSIPARTCGGRWRIASVASMTRRKCAAGSLKR
jgi:uncharacterized protein